MLKKIIYFFIFLPFAVASQKTNEILPYKPINISLLQGLAQSSVYKIVQDKQGFTWLATQDGLNRYDGLKFKIFREDPFDTTTLSSNFITSLLVDRNGWLWIGTQNHGLNLYIPSTSQFRHFFTTNERYFNQNNINDIYEDNSGSLWVATSKGFSKIIINGSDPFSAKISFKSYYDFMQPGTKKGELVINKIFQDHSDNLWVGTREGLYNFKIKDTNLITQGFYKKENGSGISGNDIRSLCEDANGKIWIGTVDGLNVYDKTSGKITNLIEFDKKLTPKLKSEVISALFADGNGNMWIGTNGGGLFELRKDNLSETFISEKLVHINLGNDRLTTTIFSITEDKINSGLIWVGTFAGGAYKIVPVLKKFYSDRLEYDGIVSPVVTCLLKDNKGFIWLGTPNGLIRQNRITNETKIFKYNDKAYSMMANYISAVVQDRSGAIWIGTEIGIQRLENTTASSPKFISYYIDPIHSKKYIRTLYLDNKDNLYITLRDSVLIYNKKQDSFEEFFVNPDTLKGRQLGYYITSMLIDRLNNCWIGTTRGLMVFRKHTGNSYDWTKPKYFYHNLKDTNSLRSQYIQSIMEDVKGNVWLSTSNGLTKAMLINDKIELINYSTENKIKNNTVYAAIEDPNTSMIWLSTNGGLTRFDPDGKNTVNFDISDGLQSNEFNGGAYSRAEDGEIFFGGIQGYTSFYPAQIKLDLVPPRVYITDFVINGSQKPFANDTAANKTVKLKYSENSFTVDFIALHYHDPLKNQYAYKLEGFQQDWTYCGNSHQVNFSQLPPGEYVFKVIASNNDGFFSQQGDSLTINIKPPFYKTIWFYLALLALVAIVLWLLHIYRLQMKLAQIKEVEKIRKETAADFHDELGHKLTTISWFSAILKKKITPDQLELRSYLDKIIETSGSLYLTMKDLLWAMDPEKDSLYHMYLQLKNFGEELFDHTGIEFNANGVNEDLKKYDLPLSYKRHILLIFKEVMHNSLKHALPTSTYLDLEKSNGSLLLRFGDNGKGFDTGNGSMNGNGIKNVKRRAEIIHANVQLKSNGTGTHFELKLDLN